MQPFVDSQPADRPTLRVVGSHEDVPTATPEPVMAHPKSFSAGLPVTGAWRPGDPVGRRQFADITEKRPFVLENGSVLTEAVVAYETWGELNDDASNAILVCHAL